MSRTEGRYRSDHLDREMEYIWFGDRGRAVIMLPTSAGRQNENEDFGLVGAVIGHLVMGLDLSMLSGMGLVALTGVVVNDSLIMVDLINRERAEHIPLNQVLLDSGIRRFRPILLTALTTIGGLLPLGLYGGVLWEGMAWAMIVGLALSTVLTLVINPILFYAMFRTRVRSVEPDPDPEPDPAS